MAKDRDKRYNSTKDLLIDLEKVRRGEAPLQARTRFDDKLLSGLANGAEEWSENTLSQNQAQNMPTTSGAPGYVIPLVAIAIIQFLVIVILVILIATRK